MLGINTTPIHCGIMRVTSLIHPNGMFPWIQGQVGRSLIFFIICKYFPWETRTKCQNLKPTLGFSSNCLFIYLFCANRTNYKDTSYIMIIFLLIQLLDSETVLQYMLSRIQVMKSNHTRVESWWEVIGNEILHCAHIK